MRVASTPNSSAFARGLGDSARYGETSPELA